MHDDLRKAIESLHACKATWRETVPVTEKHGDAIVWDGEVEVFDITGNPNSNVAYAWAYAAGDPPKKRISAVLGGGKIDSAVMAVRVAIVAQVERGKR